MKKIVDFLDPTLVVGLLISIFSSLTLVLLNQDEISSLIVGLLITVITLAIDFIGRLKETQSNILKATALGTLLIENPNLHKIITGVVNSFLAAQKSDFGLFKQRSSDALMECKDILQDIENGHMMAEPAGKYSYGRRGAKEAHKIVRAVAYEDVDSWRTEHLKGVIRSNSEVIKEGIKIQRIFVLSSDNISKAKDVLDAHKTAGVEVYTVSPDELPSTELLESFMLVDDTTLVLFYYTRDGKRFRGEKISVEPVEVDKYISKFNSIFRWAKEYGVEEREKSA